MTEKNSNSNIKIIIGVVLGLILLFFIFVRGKPKGGGGGAPSGAPSPAPTPEQPDTNCTNYAQYPYCDIYNSNITKIYVADGCSASTKLLNKLIKEGKLTGMNDDKIINCTSNPELCSKITNYPTVDCSNDKGFIGYCD